MDINRGEKSIEEVANRKAEIAEMIMVVGMMIIFLLVESLTPGITRFNQIVCSIVEIIIAFIILSTPVHNILTKAFIISEQAKKEKQNK